MQFRSSAGLRVKVGFGVKLVGGVVSPARGNGGAVGSSVQGLRFVLSAVSLQLM